MLCAANEETGKLSVGGTVSSSVQLTLLNDYTDFLLSFLSFQMGLGSNGGPFGAQPYGQGATGPGQQLNPQQQHQNKAALANSLPPFPNELKGAAVTSVPNMVRACCAFSNITVCDTGENCH